MNSVARSIKYHNRMKREFIAYARHGKQPQVMNKLNKRPMTIPKEYAWCVALAIEKYIARIRRSKAGGKR